MTFRDSKEFPATILVEGKVEKDTTYDKAYMKISDKTLVYDKRSGEKKKSDIKSLKLKQKVEATFTGPVAESYPVQTQAGSITILSD